MSRVGDELIKFDDCVLKLLDQAVAVFTLSTDDIIITDDICPKCKQEKLVTIKVRHIYICPVCWTVAITTVGQMSPPVTPEKETKSDVIGPEPSKN